jgi:hypothetical protein
LVLIGQILSESPGEEKGILEIWRFFQPYLEASFNWLGLLQDEHETPHK